MDWMEEVQRMAQTDAWYQCALEKVKKLEPAYLEILQSLPQEKREALEDYITACEAMDDALLRIAYQFGNKG